MIRYAIATVAALTVIAPSAHAATTRITFATERGAPARVAVDSPYANTRLELVRKGIVIGHGYVDELEIAGLQQDDVANLYSGSGSTLLATATYEALPAINETACIGRAAFNVRRAASAAVIDAGAYAGDYDFLQSVWTAGESLTVTLERPLQAGDVAYALTSAVTGNVEIQSYRAVPVLDCPLPPTPVHPPPVATPEIPQSPAAPTDQEYLQAVKGSVAATGSSLRPLRLPRLAKRSSFTLPFAFPEPGTVKLDLVAKGQTIGSGSKTSASNGKVSVSISLTPAGRKLLKRTKRKLKVTLKGTFTPARAGGSARNAGVTVTLKR